MIHLSFKNPYLVIVFAIIVAILSAVLIPRIPIDILPQFKKSAMQILTLYPGMPAEVVEKDITSRMERWTGQSPGIEKQLSKSIMGVSMVTNFHLIFIHNKIPNTKPPKTQHHSPPDDFFSR